MDADRDNRAKQKVLGDRASHAKTPAIRIVVRTFPIIWDVFL